MRNPGEDLGVDDRLDEVASVGEALRDRTDARSNRETVVYKVGSGDTLAGVAKQFAADVEDVARDNGLDAGDRLKEGSMLKLKVRRDVLDLGARRSGTADERDAAPAKKPSKG